MLRAWLSMALAAIALNATLSSCWAHEGAASQIHTLDHALRQSPQDATLLIKRATLHLKDQNWASAQTDFAAAIKLSPSNTDALCGSVLALIGQKKFKQAEVLTQQILTSEPDHLQALNAQADIHHALKRYEQAAVYYERLLTLIDQPRPDDYLTLAMVYHSAGSNHYPQALQTLNIGIKNLGQLFVLVEPAITIELKTGHADKAVERLRAFEKTAAPSFKWPLWRAELLEDMGSTNEAHQAYKEALTLFSKVPLKRQTLPLFADYKSRIMIGLQRTLQK